MVEYDFRRRSIKKEI